MNLLQKEVVKQFDNNLPFALYRRPKNNCLECILPQTDELLYSDDLKEEGFAFAPFTDLKKIVVFPSSMSKFIKETISEETFEDSENLDLISPLHSKIEFEKLVEKAIEEIEKKCFVKVVLSRFNEIKTENFNPFKAFSRAVQKYRNAFVYLWYHPKVGMWLGATPEKLLELNDLEFNTVALAGTISAADMADQSWSEKELVEQQIVSDYIFDQLQPISEELSIEKTVTTRAGNLLHLKTPIIGTLKKNSGLSTLIAKLHPTPAVGGYPKGKSIDFILKNEGYDRKFYTGFLGLINIRENAIIKSQLFVNLRCLEVLPSAINIYAGCGITKDSNPEKEWDETVNKMKTMWAIIG